MRWSERIYDAYSSSDVNYQTQWSGVVLEKIALHIKQLPALYGLFRNVKIHYHVHKRSTLIIQSQMNWNVRPRFPGRGIAVDGHRGTGDW
jgi:hypothetical protein